MLILRIKGGKMTKFDIFKQKGTGITKEVKQGFSWPCLLFGALWYFFKGMIGFGFLWGFVAIFVSIFTFGIGGIILWIVLGFYGNQQYREFLIGKGYIKVKEIIK